MTRSKKGKTQGKTQGKTKTGTGSVRDADRLMDEAFALLEDGEPEKALAVGRRLEKMRSPGGFEIQALALRDMDRGGEAIDALEKGTGALPEAGRLWHLLGNLLSDEGRFDDALGAYETALALPGANRRSLRFNKAMAFWRAGRLDAADAAIADLLAEPAPAEPDIGLLVNIHAARIGLLCDLGRAADAVAHYDGLGRSADWTELPDALAQLEAKHAQAQWMTGRPEAAEDALALAIRLDKTNPSAQWLRREMRGDDPAPATAFELVVEGPWDAGAFPETPPSDGFHTYYQVVAGDSDEALALVREFEPIEIRDAVEIDEVLAQEPCSEPKGVYRTSGYVFFSDE